MKEYEKYADVARSFLFGEGKKAEKRDDAELK
jgi:hypothetical protein